MPTHKYQCVVCGGMTSFIPEDKPDQVCWCGGKLVKTSIGEMQNEHAYPLWVDKVDDIHKEQADKGERLTMVYPWDVM